MTPARSVVRPTTTWDYTTNREVRRLERQLDFNSVFRKVRRDSDYVPNVIIHARRVAGIAEWTGRPALLHRHMRMVRYWSEVLWQLVGPHGHAVSAELPDGPVELAPLPECGFTKDTTWKQAWGMAWTYGDQGLERALIQTGWEFILPGPGATMTPFGLMTLEILQRIGENDPHWPQMCREGIHLSSAETVGPGMFKYYAESHTFFRLLEASTDPSDPEAFNDRLYEALIGYRNELERMNGLESEDRMIAWQILGVVARAHRAGVPITVESDYIPAWIYRAEWPEETG